MPTFLTIDDARNYFAGDLFARNAGITLDELGEDSCLCSMQITPDHQNATGGVMGGAIFTLADYALAAACNYNNKPTVSVSNTIEFLSAAKGSKLIATCEADKSGRSLGFYTVEVADDTGRKVAKMTATCFR